MDINRTETPVVVTVTAQDGTTKSSTVTVRAPGPVLSEASLVVPEGDTDSYTVRLSHVPSADVTVTVTGHSGTDVALGGLSAAGTLTFTASNWDTPQTVTVTAAPGQGRGGRTGDAHPHRQRRRIPDGVGGPRRYHPR